MSAQPQHTGKTLHITPDATVFMQASREVNVGVVYAVNKTMLPYYRIIAHEGGTRSGKTYNTIEFLVDYAQEHDGIEITIASRDMPHLKKGAIKDFKKIMRKRGLWREASWMDQDKKYTFPNGAYIEFFNADDVGKVSGPGRHILYCNEVNFFKMNVFNQLLMRTEVACIVDYNPIHARHWVYGPAICERPDCFMWRSTYRDNLPFLSKAQIMEIEHMRVSDPLRWQVYGEGKRASFQKGQIYGSKIVDGKKIGHDWEEITLSEYNKIQEQEYFGLDWGFYPDPNACLAVKFRGDERYIRKCLYKKSLSNEDTVRELCAAGLDENSIIIADTSDKKSIGEFQRIGFPLTYPAIKPKVEIGIKLLQSKKVFYVFDPDIDFEYHNYTYLLGPDEEPTGRPIDKYNHLMDCFRYVEHYKPHL